MQLPECLQRLGCIQWEPFTHHLAMPDSNIPMHMLTPLIGASKPATRRSVRFWGSSPPVTHILHYLVLRAPQGVSLSSRDNCYSYKVFGCAQACATWFIFYCVEFHLWNSCLLCISFHKIPSMAGGTSYSYTYNLMEDVYMSVVQTLHGYVEYLQQQNRK